MTERQNLLTNSQKILNNITHNLHHSGHAAPALFVEGIAKNVSKAAVSEPSKIASLLEDELRKRLQIFSLSADEQTHVLKLLAKNLVR